MSNRHALLIGNTTYDDEALQKLKAPAADVRALAELLMAPDIGGYAVTTLLDEPAYVAQRAIGAFLARRRPDDLVLLYFTGHGVLDPQGRLWLALKDTERELPTATGIGAAWLKDQMDGSRARQQLLLLDCCHSGAFSAGEKGGAALNRPAILDDTFGERGRGRVVLTATDKTSAAWEGDQVIGGAELSLFTHFVIQGIRTGEAADPQGRVTPGSLYEYVYREVSAATSKQRPRQIVYDREGEFVIAKAPTNRAGQSLPIEIQAALADPRPYVRIGAVDELARLLTDPDPSLAGPARALLEQLLTDPRQPRRVQAAAAKALDPAAAPLPAELDQPAHAELAERPVPLPAPAVEAEIGERQITLVPGVVLELVPIPAGVFQLGSDLAHDPEAQDNEQPRHTVELPAYLIGKYPVTVEQFLVFVTATGHKWKGSDLQQLARHPVSNISWRDALAFCGWLSQTTGRRVVLPSEAEWEQAARGGDGRLFPWGEAVPTDTLCNYDYHVGRTTPVGRYSPQGDSPYGCADMAGNVREWTRSLNRPYPYVAQDGREALEDDNHRVLRGGSFGGNRERIRCASRHEAPPGSRRTTFGFRVCIAPPTDAPA
ncbi:MAG: SUMF1/EgtB/PvdO family nonheme iron enzyme [Anaerolineales bacterium]|nr:SUMF1/EgtB/PvdO family nonheme iron enzyme [Anaerolineales bacterium]